MLPDLKAVAHPVLDEGRHYPHHNLYVVTSQAWDLEVLGGLLLSEVANLVHRRLLRKDAWWLHRFQAQYLRRIRVPRIENVSASNRRLLREAFNERDAGAATAVARRLYGLK